MLNRPAEEFEQDFSDYQQLVQFCRQHPEQAEQLRQQLTAKLLQRQTNDANRQALLQCQFVTEQRLKLLSCPLQKQAFIRQQLAEKQAKLTVQLTEIEQSCLNINTLLNGTK